MVLGSGIRQKPIPDPGSRIQGSKSTQSRIRIRNTEFYTVSLLHSSFLFAQLIEVPSRDSNSGHLSAVQLRKQLPTELRRTYTLHPWVGFGLILRSRNRNKSFRINNSRTNFCGFVVQNQRIPLTAQREPGVFIYENLERPLIKFPDATMVHLG